MQKKNNSIINWELHQQTLKPSPIYTAQFDFKMKNKLDRQYQLLLQTIMEHGVNKEDRTGTGTRSIFGYTIRHNMADGFPLLTTKKMYFKGIATELLWFLQGRTDLRYLLENDCRIWTGDAYKVYDKDFDREHPPFSGPYPKRLTQKEFEEKIMTDDDFNKWYGDLGPIYGKQWRSWREGKYTNELVVDGLDIPNGPTYWREGIDQIANLINDLKTNPDSRRLMVTAWNPADMDKMVLPPCHYGFQVYTRELSLEERIALIKPIPNLHTHEDCDVINLPKRAISLMWNQRSVDTFLGLPFNIASYALLLEILGRIVNMVPDQLVGNLGDTHIYNDHFEQVEEQLSRTPFELPTLNIHKTNEFWKEFDTSLFGHLDTKDFTIENYHSHPAIKAPLSN